MRLLGFGSVAVIFLSFICWFGNWAYWTFFAAAAGFSGTLSTVMRGVSTVSTLLQYLAILMLAVGLILAVKRSPGGARPNEL